MFTKLLLTIGLAASAAARQGSNYNVSSSFAEANGCAIACQKNIADADVIDLETFGQDFDFDFFATASNFSSSQPGDVLKLQTLDPSTLDVASGISVIHIQYTSKDLNGTKVPATGFIALPYCPGRVQDQPTKYPLVAYAHGTSGIYHGCAPSNSPNLYDYDSWKLLLQRGYAVVATDYAGLGNNKIEHKYVSFKAQVNDVYYSVLAARKAFGFFTESWAAAGHSQGGATVWKLSESDLVRNDTSFLGTVALAPAARIWDMFLLNLKTKGAFLGYAPYHAKAMQRVMPSYNLTVLAEPLRRRMAIADKAQLCFTALMKLSANLTNDEIVSQEGIKKDGHLFEEWQKEMSPATQGHRSSRPLLVIQGLNDSSVLPQVTRQVYEDACSAGNQVHLSEYPGMEHSPVIAAAAPEWLDWIDARFAGKSTCRQCSAKVQQPYELNLVKAPAES